MEIPRLKEMNQLLDQQIVLLEKLLEIVNAWQVLIFPSVGRVQKTIDLARQQQQLILQEVIDIQRKENNVN